MTTAQALLSAFDTGTQIAPLSDADPAFTLQHGYAIAEQIHGLRRARGERPIGRKIGFTNRTIWPIYGVQAPVWGWMYDQGVGLLPSDDSPVHLPPLPELRIEPEIVFRFARSPAFGMDDAELAACIDGVAHAIELVFSVYPGWRFTAPDTAAAFGMHAGLIHAPFQDPSAVLADGGAALSAMRITLEGPDTCLSGKGSDVLGGPLQALRFLLDDLEDQPGRAPILPGEIVTTGTLTDAVPVASGQTWRTVLVPGAPLAGITVRFAAG